MELLVVLPTAPDLADGLGKNAPWEERTTCLKLTSITVFIIVSAAKERSIELLQPDDAERRLLENNIGDAESQMHESRESRGNQRQLS